MNRRHLLSALMTVGIAGCQLSPHPADTAVSPSSQPLTPATKSRLAKAGLSQCTRVAAYVINKSTPLPNPSQTLVIDGRMNPDRTPLQGVTLTDAQVNAFLDATTVKDYPSIPAHCFYPRHAIAFYKADGTLMGNITICFSCSGYRADTGTFVQSPDYRALRRLF